MTKKDVYASGVDPYDPTACSGVFILPDGFEFCGEGVRKKRERVGNVFAGKKIGGFDPAAHQRRLLKGDNS